MMIKNYLDITNEDLIFLLRYSFHFKSLYSILQFRPYYKHFFIINVIILNIFPIKYQIDTALYLASRNKKINSYIYKPQLIFHYD